ncbi:hypothetical protein MKX01_010936 [Papaver californicum]|nr:hypothetical protein MKX01_010936 [Papaver californicum]
MTTGGRPTWTPAKGGEEGGNRNSGNFQRYSSRDMASHTTLKSRGYQEELEKRNLQEKLEQRERKRYAEDRIVLGSIGADDYDGNSDEESDDEDNDDDTKADNEDDTKALLAEREHIKKERNKERLEQEEELKVQEAELIRGNSLVNSIVKEGGMTMWLLKDQTRSEAKTPKRFINDTVRNDYHTKLLRRYIQ